MDAVNWNSLIASFSQPHILQTWEWGQFKARYGWKPDYRIFKSGSSQPVGAGLVLSRSLHIGRLTLPVRILYVPKGPLVDWSESNLFVQVLDELADYGRRARAIFVKIDPDVALGSGIPGKPDAIADPIGECVESYLSAHGWKYSQDQIQFRNTVMIDLQPGESELLVQMKQKTRYNIRLAERKGVTVRHGSREDLTELYRLYAETSVRDGFVIRSEDYYLELWSSFMKSGLAIPLVAEVQGIIVAGLILFLFGKRAWYLFGMSGEQHRPLMPNYLLQWGAIQTAKQAGCTTFDLWGAPDVFDEADPLWGVYRFKEGLGGKVVRHIGAWDLPLQPAAYQMYTRLLPAFMEQMRKQGTKRTKQSIGL